MNAGTAAALGLLAASYLLGAVPFGVLFARFFSAVDPRRSGSGNIGATNVARTAGPAAGLATLAADLLKGFLPAAAALSAFTGPEAPFAHIAPAAALLAFAGHCFPLYSGFRGGGKGVATAAGGFLALAPYAVAVAAAAFFLAFLACRRVSVGSLSAAAVLPWAVYFSTGSGAQTAAAAAVCLLVFLRHADNLRRLAAGTEPRFRLKS
ncbi:MAG: glycerol-3-phosphate 1-O-acyltransferase PlsY [Desulfobacterales bacterium]